MGCTGSPGSEGASPGAEPSPGRSRFRGASVRAIAAMPNGDLILDGLFTNIDATSSGAPRRGAAYDVVARSRAAIRSSSSAGSRHFATRRTRPSRPIAATMATIGHCRIVSS